MNAIVLPGDCRKIIAGLADRSVDAIVTDPPYELGFMGKRWDASGIAYDVNLWAECLRVLKPGGHLLAFGGTRTYHRMTCAIEDAGFEVRDSIHWLYGSGFPKSLDVSKAIDKVNGEPDRLLRFTLWFRTTGLTVKQVTTMLRDAGLITENGTMAGHYFAKAHAGQPAIPTAAMWAVIRPHVGDVPDWVDELVARIEAEREVVGTKTSGIANKDEGPRHTIGASQAVTVDITAPATDAARQWEGWGTALKPAHEPIVVARKPLVGTVAATVLEHGTGALNIDGCRVALASEADEQESKAKNQHADFGTKPGRNAVYGDYSMVPPKNYNPPGRWPANLVIDDVIAGRHPEWGHYFYCAKPSKKERNAGLDDLPDASRGNQSAWVRECGTCGCRFTDPATGKPKCKHNNVKFTPPSPTKNTHPTVKPLALMRWLVRLVTPPGGTVLDPFAGSGTTLVAAILEGFDAVGCEMTEDYLPIIDGRIAWAEAERAKTIPTLFGDAA